mgnify:CR=1 FL=1
MNQPALLELLTGLRLRDYAFVTPTPATHARVLARAGRDRARDLAGIFGWSLPFERGSVDEEIEAAADLADILEEAGDGLWQSRLRVSTLHGRLFLHSAYPTEAQDAVFFGPDSYRFADLIALELGDCAPRARIVDIGTGAGVGAIVAAGRCPEAHVTMTDINPAALELARVNAAFNEVEAEFLESDALTGVAEGIEVALANPPYIIDDGERAYRHGGDMYGGQASFDMALAAAERLNSGGRLILYTGSAIVDGKDVLREALAPALAERGCDLRYREIDPDVFGEELEHERYAEVDRIAVVAAIATRRG